MARSEHVGAAVGSPLLEERPRLMDWLDDGLREGERGRLDAEYGPLLVDAAANQIVVREGGRIRAHALARTVNARAGQVRLRLGMIGLVYTDPECRGRGFGSRCVEAAVAALSGRGAEVVCLWSDEPAFYERLGFSERGVERLVTVDRVACEGAGSELGASCEVGSPSEEDWVHLEALYAERSSCVERAPGAMRALARAPECEVVVHRRAGRPIAYAALGRGHDFRGVVHEWAGPPAEVLACLRGLLASRSSLLCICGPGDAGLELPLRRAGASVYDRKFALTRILDPCTLWARLAKAASPLRDVRFCNHDSDSTLVSGGHTLLLSADELGDLLLEPGRAEELADGLSPMAGRALRALLPLPLFVWGFDSV